MNTLTAAVAVLAAASLALVGCGGASEGSAPEGAASTPATSQEGEPTLGGGDGSAEGAPEAPGVAMEGPVTQRDIGELGRTLGWEGCDEPDVDMAGYPVVVCIFPDEYAVPGQDGNAVRVMTFTEWDQAMQYVMEYGDPDAVTVMDGYIVDGPHAKAVDAAVTILEG